MSQSLLAGFLNADALGQIVIDGERRCGDGPARRRGDHPGETLELLPLLPPCPQADILNRYTEAVGM
jgi:hypothetical protein